MNKGRLEAFSDGVIAVIITIMVLDLKEPANTGFDAFRPLVPLLLSYLLSFINVGIYWNNHHHLLHLVEKIDGSVLWANLHLLFWLSLLPFTTAWLAGHHEASLPAACYGVVLLMAAVAYGLLQSRLIRVQGNASALAGAIGGDFKGKLSPVIYVVGIGLSFVSAHVGEACYVIVALIWLVPDRRIERLFVQASGKPES
jgi:uncharacterized membrane protein